MENVKQPQGKKPESKRGERSIFKFEKINHRLILIGIGILLLGFILLIGGGSKNPNVFNPAIFNFQRMKVAPILLGIGYLTEIFAIMYVPKDKRTSEKDETKEVKR